MASNNGYGDTIITTTDDEGEIHLFEKIQDLELEGKQYALMVYLGTETEYEGKSEDADDEEEKPGKKAAKPVKESAKKATESDNGDGDGYDEEVVVMKVTMEEGVEVYEAVEDEAEFEKVVQHIEKLMEEEDEDEIIIDLEELLKESEGHENN